MIISQQTRTELKQLSLSELDSLFKELKKECHVMVKCKWRKCNKIFSYPAARRGGEKMYCCGSHKAMASKDRIDRMRNNAN